MKHFMCFTASFKFYKGFEMTGLCSRIRLHQTLNGYNLKKKLNNYLSSSRPPFIKQFVEPVSVVDIHFGIDEITDTEN